MSVQIWKMSSQNRDSSVSTSTSSKLYYGAGIIGNCRLTDPPTVAPVLRSFAPVAHDCETCTPAPAFRDLFSALVSYTRSSILSDLQLFTILVLSLIAHMASDRGLVPATTSADRTRIVPQECVPRTVLFDRYSTSPFELDRCGVDRGGSW